MRRLDFDSDAITRPHRAVHALGRRLGLCRWWLIQYVQHPRTMRPRDVVTRMQRLLEPERTQLVRLASLYGHGQPNQYAFFDPVRVLTELGRRGVRARDLPAWLRDRATVAEQVSESISRREQARWSATRDGAALVDMVSAGQITEAWVQQALVELQGEELGHADSSRRKQAARVLQRVGRALLAAGRGRRRQAGPKAARPHDRVTQARSRRKSTLIRQIERRAASGENLAVVADEILYDFVASRDTVLDRAQRESVARRVRARLGL